MVAVSLKEDVVEDIVVVDKEEDGIVEVVAVVETVETVEVDEEGMVEEVEDEDDVVVWMLEGGVSGFMPSVVVVVAIVVDVT